MCFKGVGGRRVSRGVGDIRTKAACRNIPALALGRAESIAPSTAETSGLAIHNMSDADSFVPGRFSHRRGHDAAQQE